MELSLLNISKQKMFSEQMVVELATYDSPEVAIWEDTSVIN